MLSLIMAQDEGRFGRNGQVMQSWCLTGVRPLVALARSAGLCLCLCSDRPFLGQDDGTVSERG